MTLYRRAWGDNGRLELRLTWTTLSIAYQRRAVGGGWYDRDHQSIPLPWHRFT